MVSCFRSIEPYCVRWQYIRMSVPRGYLPPWRVRIIINKKKKWANGVTGPNCHSVCEHNNGPRGPLYFDRLRSLTWSVFAKVFQSLKRVQAFFHLHCVHHCSRWSMPYTFRHFLFSPRILRGETGVLGLMGRGDSLSTLWGDGGMLMGPERNCCLKVPTI